MEEAAAKRFLERGEERAAAIDELPPKFFEPLVTKGLRVDLIEPGRILCSFTVPNRLLNAGNFLHGGATATLVDLVGSAVMYTVGASMTGVSVEINVSYLDAAYAGEEIEVEAKSLRVGKAIAVVSVEFRKKKTSKIVAQGRHTKYLALSSKI
ncbi:Phenylacetic acid degradation-related domain containing protein [Parasponia andersonii]|uniref:Phenylacetic acid degradation-related domain containing protein n=1 Tax=Parasponia andersonii TaxID=3476 RepID=A0A2P5AGD4_PARAD|nr:Phenylacetic acid degradation-related domain containing protein [Parasponia andersonii]